MYNDCQDYLNFLKENNICISSEPVSQAYTACVINPKLDWLKISEEYKAKKIVIIDDFLNDEIAIRLRNFVLFSNCKEDFYKDYAAINFYKENNNDTWFPILTNLVEEISANFKLEKPINFLRAWSFIYNTQSNGVTIHADPAAINFNLWVTPDECMIDSPNTNGLDIWNVYPPSEWQWQTYNRDPDKINAFIADSNCDKVSIEYKFNRLVLFDSKFFHKTQPITTKTGYANRRINYTFLFE
jgi:hypothetical protein